MDGHAAFRFIPASGPAAMIAEGVWELCLPASAGPLTEAVAPDGRCEIVFHLGAPPAARQGQAFGPQPEAFLYGPLDRALVLRREAGLHMRAIRLTPWGIGMLTRGARAMAGLAVSIRDALGDTGARLEEAARQAVALDAFAAAAFSHLAGHAGRQDRLPERGLAALMLGAPDTMTCDARALAETSGFTRRTFERQFNAASGLTPGSWLRICRFQRARAQVISGIVPLAEIALEAGYADQAHMTRDFRRYEAVSPAALRRQQGGFEQIYAPSSDNR